MKSLSTLFLALICTTLLTACGDEFFGIKGEGPVISENRTVPGFDEIDLAVDGTVFLSQGAQEEIRIEAQENILNNLETAVQGSALKIKFDENVRQHSHIRIYITTPEIKGLSISGSGSIKGQNKFTTEFLSLNVSGSGDASLEVDAEHLHSTISGSGHINFSGQVNKHSVTISGSGEVKAYELQSQQADVHISGSGGAQLWVNDRLDAQISGSGSVTYKGTPDTVNTHISGSGKVRPY